VSIHPALAALVLLVSVPLVSCDRGSPDGAPRHVEDAGLYTCGMHPEVIHDGPGSCPICGMNLTPVRRGPASDRERTISHWAAPMDPTYISDGPGKSPMGMDLIPVYEEADRHGLTVTINPVVVQNMGIRVAPAHIGPIFRHVRSIGEIEVAEDEISVVNLRYSGWIETIHVDETGTEVRKGQALFDIYSPELVSAQEEFLLALRTDGADGARARSARTRLRNWEVPNSTIDRLAERMETSRTITVRAPRAGFVLHKNVVEGARVNAGSDLYRIGNLQNIWVRAEVYEADAPWVRVGQKAAMELSFQAGAPLIGTVSYVYPTLNPRSRTLTVRLEFPNPGLALKPGMFATIRIETRRKDDALVIPTEAILHSGERQIVFVADSIGRYSPRDIDTGLVGDRQLTEVVGGLEAGEMVVVSGQFLLDSESQLQEAINKLLEARLQIDPHPDAGPVPGEGEVHTFSCPMHPEIVQDEFGTCPICGMDLIEPAP
jgi:Cu(I)/Ag(I) efflux system membrane fusion protein/cobalt-zinc-cadmium efflux system membrane fusion protein